MLTLLQLVLSEVAAHHRVEIGHVKPSASPLVHTCLLFAGYAIQLIDTKVIEIANKIVYADGCQPLRLTFFLSE